MLREPAVAGQFYPGNKAELEQLVEALMPQVVPQQAALAVMSPHAGYIYSGRIAGQTFAGIHVPRDVLIIGPNHHGYGQNAAVESVSGWRTPLGNVPLAEDLVAAILQHCPLARADSLAHRFEHSLEVQVPFLQARAAEHRIAPLCVGRLSLVQLLELGDGVAAAIKAHPEPVLIVASSDMTHYESGEVARRKDQLALERVLALDPRGLYEVVRANRISMCGMMPTVIMLQAVNALGASRAELVCYGNSGDVTGDQSEVVGYAGVRIL